MESSMHLSRDESDNSITSLRIKKLTMNSSDSLSLIYRNPASSLVSQNMSSRLRFSIEISIFLIFQLQLVGISLSVALLSETEYGVKYELSRTIKSCNLMLFAIYALLCFNWFLIGAQWFLNNNNMPEIECRIKDLLKTKWTFYQRRNITTPKLGDTIYIQGCTYIKYNYRYLAKLPYNVAKKIVDKEEEPDVVHCNEYVIKKDVPNDTSYVKEFGIICFKKIFHVTDPYLIIGNLLITFPVGVLADVYGRKPVHIYCTITLSLISFVVPLSPNFVTFAITKVIVGGCLLSTNLILNVLYSEICRLRCREISTTMAFVWFIVGSKQIHIASKIIQVWRLRCLSLAVCSLICLYGAVFMVPESPRFLLAHKKFKRAWECLEELGSTSTPPSDVENYDTKQKRKCLFQMEILTKKFLLIRIIIISFLNCSGVYFYFIFRSMAIHMIPLSNTLHIQSSIAQILCLIGTSMALLKYPKQNIICIYYLILSTCFVIRMATKVVIILDVTSFAGNLIAVLIYIMTYLCMIDHFPTTHRATAIGFCFLVQSIVIILANYFYEDLSLRNQSALLNGLYCCASILSFIATLATPATDSDIPDNGNDLFRVQSLSLSEDPMPSSVE